MLNLFIKELPIVAQSVGFTRTAMKVYKSTSPVEAVKIAAISILDECAPPQVKYPIKCGILIAQIGIAVTTGGNTWSVAMAIGAARQIIE